MYDVMEDGYGMSEAEQRHAEAQVIANQHGRPCTFLPEYKDPDDWTAQDIDRLIAQGWSWQDDGDPENGPGQPYLAPPEEPMLVGCYSCHREAGNDPMDPAHVLPQRHVISTTTVIPADPTTACKLECGHTII